MNSDFARKLIEHPGEFVTKQLFAGGIPGVFWVDWREADSDIVTMAAKAIGTDDLTAEWAGEKLVILHRKVRTVVPLTGKPGEQGITMCALNEALAPHIEIRFVRASDGGDTLAFMPLHSKDWTAFQAIYGPKLTAAFAKVEKNFPLSEPEAPDPGAMKQMRRQMRGVKFARANFRMHTTRSMDEALANPALAGPSMPVFEPLFGDLVLSYFHDLRPTFPPATVGELDSYDMSLPELRAQALQNGFARWNGMRIIQCGPYFTLNSTNGSAASAVMHDKLWDEMEKFEGDITAAFPQQDLVMYASTRKPEAITGMREALAKLDFNRPDALSRNLYDRQGKRWSLRRGS